MQAPISPFVMVIFGATGDLTARKLMPALYNLMADSILPDNFYVVGFARRAMSHGEFRAVMHEAVVKHSRRRGINSDLWSKLVNNLYYQQGFFEDALPYEKLVKLLKTFDDKLGACITRFFYLATPPQNYSEILTHLDSSKLSEGCGQGSAKWTRVLIEKPFGKDLSTSMKLEKQLSQTFEERQIYRIDHYLAKDTIQNILAFRFANGIFETIWNKESIDHVQITIAESGGVGTRGMFYEGVGALKDVAQNHLMAMLAYTTMEAPFAMDAHHIRAQRVKALETIRPLTYAGVTRDIVRGQYGPGIVGGKEVVGYRQEKHVDPNSITDTFVAFKLFLDNPRWQGVPFYLRTGKRLAASVGRVSVQFKKTSHHLFDGSIASGEHAHDNVLTFRIQPREGISLQMYAKEPGLGYSLHNVKMDFSYETTFKNQLIDSYERVLIDSMKADQTSFATNAGFNATWKLMTQIEDIWKKEGQPPLHYAAGTWGPDAAFDLLKRDGRHWLLH